MGWASYQEDIMSRFVAARRPSVRVFQASIAGPAPKVVGSEGNGMAELKDFVIQTARPLPVVVLADVSGSMKENGKIDALNEAVSNMISAFAEEETARAEIQFSVITFGAGGAKIHHPLRVPVPGDWVPLTAKGTTPLGDALDLARTLLEDREQVPSRAYRPTLILISDGQPTGGNGKPTTDWRDPLQQLLGSERASKAMRFAMAIGDDADHEVLNAFLADPSRQVFSAAQARQIKQFFQWVTMSVTARSRSGDPNAIVFNELSDDELDY
jgi:uncharacterized protein YegL